MSSGTQQVGSSDVNIQIPNPTQEQATSPTTLSEPVEPASSTNDPIITKSPNGKSPKLLILGLVILLVLGIGIFFASRFVMSYFKKDTVKPVPIDYPNNTNHFPQNDLVEKPIVKPLMAPDFLDKRFWEEIRNEKVDVSEAQRIMNGPAGVKMGFIPISKPDVYTHKEVYKGIPIMWSDGQPIPENKVEWIKRAIDIVPPVFLSDYPINGIYSATIEEMDVDFPSWSPINLPGIVGFASGGNIFLTKYFTTGKTTSTLYQPPKESDTIYILIHEWTHIAQNYEQVKTFKEEYLLTGPVVYNKTAFIKTYAKSAGWVFGSATYPDDGSFLLATLKTDAESQKTTKYGRTNYIEDQADSTAMFFTCKASVISNTRKGLIEDMFNVKYIDICD